MTRPRLLASAYTTAGAVGPFDPDPRSTESFEDRITVAAKAGYEGIGFSHADIVQYRETIGLAQMRERMDAVGLEHVELEMLMDWYADGEARTIADRVLDDLVEAAEALRPLQIKAGTDYDNHDRPMEDLVREFRRICDRAQEVGTRIALEPQPMAAIGTPRQALDLVTQAAHPVGGLIIDIWHVERGNVPMPTLTEIPLDLLYGIEINDAPGTFTGSMLKDTTTTRRFLGEGDFDVEGFIKTVQGMGYEGLWGVEIISDEFRSLPMPTGAKKAFDTTIAFFEGVGAA